ncbi:protein app1 [Austrofundulus limnaeus]|uniref:Protein app1 n=1 Tax=Austrofundulus limnaeus TaxID=52670 RepID=A0A2I4C081_AUSLI|nr:PREDICTED: protein app1-like [Austrofundulus limnaeus]
MVRQRTQPTGTPFSVFFFKEEQDFFSRRPSVSRSFSSRCWSPPASPGPASAGLPPSALEKLVPSLPPWEEQVISLIIGGSVKFLSGISMLSNRFSICRQIERVLGERPDLLLLPGHQLLHRFVQRVLGESSGTNPPTPSAPPATVVRVPVPVLPEPVFLVPVLVVPVLVVPELVVSEPVVPVPVVPQPVVLQLEVPVVPQLVVPMSPVLASP